MNSTESTEPKACCMPAAARADTVKIVPKVVPQATAPSASGSIEGMKLLPGSEFLMGTNSEHAWPGDGEGPVRAVHVDAFYIDVCAVTNREFEKFVNATGYVTEAEEFGWSYVFHKHVNGAAKAATRGSAAGAQWWIGVDGACWRRPEGPGSNVRKRAAHPVVHVSWNDAQAFCCWAGKRLPTDAEWEYAARGGLEQKLYPWGDELTPGGKHWCNIWQGKFPHFDAGADGWTNTAPVKSFKPNGFGLYNMAGNAWEWCSDWFSPDFHHSGPRDNPIGPPVGTNKIIKGGSFLCHASYCNRYRVAARTANTPDSASAHCGFRCARGVDVV